METNSQTYHDIFAAVATHTSNFNPILSLTTKIINAFLIEQNWLTLKVIHHLLGVLLVNLSRIIVSINIRLSEQQNLCFEI